MFWKRLISGIVLVAVALLTICTGGYVLFFTLLLLSFKGARELYRALKVTEKGKYNLLEMFGYLGIILYYLGMLFSDCWESARLIALILALILVMFLYVFTYPKYHASQIISTVFGILYVGVMLSFIYEIRNMVGGALLVWLVFLCSWGCDTCAYCVGMLFGKHKMAPVLSPKKSVEGAVGGVVGAVLLGIIYGAIFKGPMVQYAVICGIGALISMVGDLTASAIKRNMEIKDYGKLIPGHGGVLDRFDSVIFTAPVIYAAGMIFYMVQTGICG